MTTRFVVDIDAGTTLMAVQQNASTVSNEVAALRGQPVELVWQIEHEYPLG
ncbi:MAG: hypothetical protein ACKOW5_12525 [Actinomycetales bacterium]